jgi:ABC-type transport system substrate-binding protein
VRPSRIRSGCKVPLLYNQHSYYGDGLASRVAEDLAKVGIEVVREPCESSDELVRVLKERRHREEDPYLFIYNWYSILPAAEIFLRPLFEDSWDDNLTGYCDATAELQRLRDPNLTASQRIAAYRAAQQKIVNDLPLICLGHPRVRFSAYNSRVSGLGLNVQSFPVDRFFGVDVS